MTIPSCNAPTFYLATPNSPMNPYAPPTTDVSMAAPARRKPVAFVLIGLALLQLLWVLFYGSAYLELARTHAISPLTSLSGFLGCVLLYAGVARFALNPARGRRLFVAAFVLLAVSLWGWDWRYLMLPAYPLAFGAAIAAAGWWFSRGRPQQVDSGANG